MIELSEIIKKNVCIQSKKLFNNLKQRFTEEYIINGTTVPVCNAYLFNRRPLVLGRLTEPSKYAVHF